MEHKKAEELQGWATEKFGLETKLGCLARMPSDMLTDEEVSMLEAAREGWLVGLDEVHGVEMTEVDYSCID